MRPSTCSRVWSSPAACKTPLRRLLLGAALILALPASAQPAISIIIDDLGDRLAESRAVAELPGPVACAILPETPHAQAVARLAQARGKEVLLHLPLQPQQGPAHPLSLRADMTLDQREAVLQRALRALPQAVGVNNHQGSNLTARADWMRWLMQSLQQHGPLYFVDSRTAPDTVAEAAAWAQGLDATRRQVFLDHTRGAAAVRKEWQRLLLLARRDGTALAIGHPYPETLALLREELPRLTAQGVTLVSPSVLIRLQGTSPSQRVAALRLRNSGALGSTTPDHDAAAAPADGADGADAVSLVERAE